MFVHRSAVALQAYCRCVLISVTNCCTPLQIALSRLSEATDSNEHAHANQWSGHPAVPDIISQKGTGPHAVDYENTVGKHLLLVTSLYKCIDPQRPEMQRLLLHVSVIKPHMCTSLDRSVTSSTDPCTALPCRTRGRHQQKSCRSSLTWGPCVCPRCTCQPNFATCLAQKSFCLPFDPYKRIHTQQKLLLAFQIHPLPLCQYQSDAVYFFYVTALQESWLAAKICMRVIW